MRRLQRGHRADVRQVRIAGEVDANHWEAQCFALPSREQCRLDTVGLRRHRIQKDGRHVLAVDPSRLFRVLQAIIAGRIRRWEYLVSGSPCGLKPLADADGDAVAGDEIPQGGWVEFLGHWHSYVWGPMRGRDWRRRTDRWGSRQSRVVTLEEVSPVPARLSGYLLQWSQRQDERYRGDTAQEHHVRRWCRPLKLWFEAWSSLRGGADAQCQVGRGWPPRATKPRGSRATTRRTSRPRSSSRCLGTPGRLEGCRGLGQFSSRTDMPGTWVCRTSPRTSWLISW